VRRTVFLDRDGTLNAEVGFVARPDQLQILPGVLPALRRLDAAGFDLIVVTNQSGIARGLYTEADLARVHEAMHESLDHLPLAYLHCPHHPEGGHGYGGTCACRKPGSGLLHLAHELLGVGFDGGAIVGDSARDLLMAPDLPLVRVLVQSGKDTKPELDRLREAGCRPGAVRRDLTAAVDWLLDADGA
jgi:D-glycero-D-manno-heptose 1,7-bisphosphate phosphatase